MEKREGPPASPGDLGEWAGMELTPADQNLTSEGRARSSRLPEAQRRGDALTDCPRELWRAGGVLEVSV